MMRDAPARAGYKQQQIRGDISNAAACSDAMPQAQSNKQQNCCKLIHKSVKRITLRTRKQRLTSANRLIHRR